MPVSVFISHSSKDHALVRELRQALEGLQIVTWVDSERLTAGEALKPEINANIEKAAFESCLQNLDEGQRPRCVAG